MKVLVLAGAAVVAAVAAWILWPSGTPVRTLAPIEFAYTVNGPGTSLNFFTWSSTGKPMPPIAPGFASLRTKRTPQDDPPALPRMMLAGLAGPARMPGVGSALRKQFEREGPGKVQMAQSHLLLEAGGRSLYAAPTTHGAVCFVVVPGLASECVRELSEGLVSLSLVQTPKGTLAVGLVPDRVTKVELAVGKDRRTAMLARNGFLFDAVGIRATEIDALVVTAGGKRFRLPLARRVFKGTP